MTPDRIVEKRAAQSHGIVSASQALAAGMTRRMIRKREVDGDWVRVFPDQFRVAAAPDSWEGRLTAAAGWLGPQSVFSHRTAGELYRLDGVPSGFVELTACSSASHPGLLVHRRSELPSRARSTRGFRVTTVEQTLLDLCAVLPPVKCGRAIDDALRRRLTTLDRLREIQKDAPPKSGIKVFRLLLSFRDEHDERVQSQLETRLLRILKRIRGYELVPQCKVVDGVTTYYIDFGYPREMLGIEGHSIRWHLGEDAFKADVKRQRHLQRLGWTVLYFLWDEIWYRADSVEAEIRDALTSIRENDSDGRLFGKIVG